MFTLREFTTFLHFEYKDLAALISEPSFRLNKTNRNMFSGFQSSSSTSSQVAQTPSPQIENLNLRRKNHDTSSFYNLQELNFDCKE